MNVNIQNQNPLLTKLSTSTVNSIGSTAGSAPRYALSINNNVANINNALLRNVQLSPKSKISLTSNQQQQQQPNLLNTISNIQNYSLNLQSQLNYVNLKATQQQQHHQQQQQQQQQSNASLLTAASVLANNNLSAQMYQPMQQTTCNLNNTLFVGNLHASLQEIDLIQVFRPFGRIVECCKKWLHFGFVKFTTEEEACHAYVTLNGFRLKGRPMRLEFQNRTKKARIKAILAQAALQAANGSPCNPDLLSMGNVNIAGVNNIQLGYTNLIDDRQQIFYQNINSNKKAETKESSFFNSDQLMKFASATDNVDHKDKQFEMNFDLAESNNYYDLNSIDLSSYSTSVFDPKMETKLTDDLLKESEKRSQSDDFLMSLLKRHHSPSDSPTHEALSLSSDSGCRSNSFLNDEDSAITSIQSSVRTVTKSKGNNKSKKIDEVTLSEHLEFTCSKSSPIKEEKEEFSKHVDDEIDDEDDQDDDDDCSSDCDTSDDASDIPSEADGDSDCLNDLDLLDENFLNGSEYECDEETKYFNQVMDKDGSVTRKKLENGIIYKSVNSTFSLYIEPHDILKQVDTDEFDEYSLFPSEADQPIHESLMLFKSLCCV